MKQNRIVKLIYDKYENEVGIIYDAEMNEIENDHTKILEQLPTKINDIEINTDRVININTWGIKKPFSTECDIIFDLTKFQTKIDKKAKFHKRLLPSLIKTGRQKLQRETQIVHAFPKESAIFHCLKFNFNDLT